MAEGLTLFVDRVDNFHPYECDGPGLCPRCPTPRTDLTPAYVALKLARLALNPTPAREDT